MYNHQGNFYTCEKTSKLFYTRILFQAMLNNLSVPDISKIRLLNKKASEFFIQMLFLVLFSGSGCSLIIFIQSTEAFSSFFSPDHPLPTPATT